jgi:hypothetical protein
MGSGLESRVSRPGGRSHEIVNVIGGWNGSVELYNC